MTLVRAPAGERVETKLSNQLLPGWLPLKPLFHKRLVGKFQFGLYLSLASFYFSLRWVICRTRSFVLRRLNVNVVVDLVNKNSRTINASIASIVYQATGNNGPLAVHFGGTYFCLPFRPSCLSKHMAGSSVAFIHNVVEKGASLRDDSIPTTFYSGKLRE